MPISASERLRLIKGIAERLSQEEWALIDLTLKTFSLPWSETWSGSKMSYLLEMVEEAPDQTLVDLGQHVGISISKGSAGALGIEPPFWRKGMFKVFLSHLAKERAFAAALQEEFLQYGISCFVAHNDIEPTLEWQTEIETALTTCDALVALLHPSFHKSNWTDQEIGFAMGRGVSVFAARLGQDPYGFIGRFQAFNGAGKNSAKLAKEIFNAYRKNKQTQHQMAEILVGMFEQSNSFAEAKSRIGYLEELETWDASFSNRIRSAAKANGQIIGAWGVPERVNQLADTWDKP